MDQQQFIELLKEINIAQIFVILTAGWFFYNRLDKKITRSQDKVCEQIKTLSEKVEDIDRRLCHIEGGISFVHFAHHVKRKKLRPISPETQD